MISTRRCPSSVIPEPDAVRGPSKMLCFCGKVMESFADVMTCFWSNHGKIIPKRNLKSSASFKIDNFLEIDQILPGQDAKVAWCQQERSASDSQANICRIATGCFGRSRSTSMMILVVAISSYGTVEYVHILQCLHWHASCTLFLGSICYLYRVCIVKAG